MKNWVLGISAYYHDSAAALVCEGEIISAVQEERFTRKKGDARFPIQSIKACLKEAQLAPTDLRHVVFYDKPLLKFERLIETYLQFAPRGLVSYATAMPSWIKQKLFLKAELVKNLRRLSQDVDWRDKLLFSEHHLSHAASAFYPSPFEEALILTMDGVGEWSTTSVAIGKGHSIEILKEIHFPHSLGLLYSAITSFLGFKVNSGEYKIMGLAPYGSPRFADAIFEHMIDVKSDGSFRLNMEFFDYCTDLRMFNEKRFVELFKTQPRAPEAPLESIHMDISASIQKVTETVVLKMGRALAQETGIKNLCLAGGVALNCVANGKLKQTRAFNHIWVQPASGDAGGALGAALVGSHLALETPRRPRRDQDLDGMTGAYLGIAYSNAEIESELRRMNASFEVLSEDELIHACVDALASEQALGWFQGRMEFGPRSLGARSILADARSPRMQSQLNLKIKYRESFRPFAPAVLEEEVADWFEFDETSPYMLMVADVVPEKRITMTETEQRLFGIDKLNVARSKIPAVTHIDYSARLQTVSPKTNPLFHRLLKGFKEKTGCPVLVNTSFNIRGEPIVCTPEDAYRCFMGTELDVLVIGNCLLRKSAQRGHKVSYRDQVELD